MHKINRREFIVDSGLLLALFQTSGLLEGCQPTKMELEKLNSGLQITQENGLNLVLYFINLTFSGGHLIPQTTGNPYIIVQLPPQSLHEQYFRQTVGPDEVPKNQLEAKLSIPTFLSFKLWPDPKIKKKIKFSPEALLDWENGSVFQLMTTSDISGTFPVFNKPEDVGSVVFPEIKKGEIVGLEFYTQLVSKLITNTKEPFISIIGLPAGLILAPHTWKLAKGSPPINIHLTQNTYSLSVREYVHFINRDRLKRTVRERWNVEVKYKVPDSARPNLQISIPPALRALAIFSDTKFTPADRIDPCAYPKLDAQSADTYLPSFLDETELLYLNQISNSDRGFDINIKEGTPFLLTSNGATVQFVYGNFQIPQTNAYKKISLVGYEHHFQDGRDNYIKVSRIGVIAPTSQKALHVKIAERTIKSGESFMLYYEYIELLDPDKTFPSVNPDGASTNFRTYRNLPHYNNQLNFGYVKAGFKVTPHILPLNDDTINHFWVYKEFGKQQNQDLLKLPFNYTDRAGRPIGRAPDQAIYFMRRDFFCDETQIKRVLEGNPNANPVVKPLMVDYDDGERMRIPFHNQVIAFTPDDSAKTGNGDLANKINQMQTEFIDYKFSIANAVTGVPNIFDRADFPIFPQLTRAKVFIDHIQQYSPQKLPSLIEYHEDYLSHYFESKVDNTGKIVGNQAKLIVKHTKDFIDGKIYQIDGATEQLSQDYQLLKSGYQRIQDVFNISGDRIGAMVNPSIEIQRFALVRQAMTLPDKVNQQWQGISQVKDRVLHTLDIFNGKSPEIFNGISLKMILQDVLNAGKTPDLQLNKVLGTIDSIDNFLNQLGNNKIVQQTLAAVKSVNGEVNTLSEGVQNLQSKLDQAKQTLVDKQNQLINSLPDINKLKNACQNFFETEKLNLFAKIGAADADIQTFIKSELIIAKNNVNTIKNTATDIFALDFPTLIDTVIAKIGNVDAALLGQLTRMKTFISSLSASYTSLMAGTLNDISTSAAIVQGDLGLADYYGPGGKFTLEDQLTNLTAVYLKNPSQALAGQIAQCQTDLDNINKKINNSIYGGLKILLNCCDLIEANLSAYQDKLKNLKLFVNLFIKANIGYYIERYRQYQKDYQDIKLTIQDFGALLGSAEQLARTVAANRKQLIGAYINDLISYTPGTAVDTIAKDWNKIRDNDDKLISSINSLFDSPEGKKILASAGGTQMLQDVSDAQLALETAQGKLDKQVIAYQQKLQFQAEGLIAQLQDTFNTSLNGLNLDEIRQANDEFQQTLKILTSPIQQQLSYQWQTSDFKSADLGIIRFNPGSSPATALNVNVTGKITLDPLHYPQVVSKIETYAENSLTNFGVTFLSVITIDFASISFVAGSSVSKNFSVKVRDVKFDGALSFIQKLEDLLGNLGDGFGIAIQPMGVAITYNSPVLGISAPGFTFDNISIGVRLDLYFDQKPLLLSLSLSTPEAKATIAAGVYGGCFFCSLSIDPKNGMRAIEMAMEMGAFLGISIGPIKGSVKFMVGLYFKKDDSGVTMEGYFIAEGILSVWILSVSARLYMYVRSQNSYVEGGCTVTYSVKLGFISKSFSGSYSKKLAGAESSHSQNQQFRAMQIKETFSQHRLAGSKDDLEDLIYAIFDEDQHEAMDDHEWSEFYHTFYQ